MCGKRLTFLYTSPCEHVDFYITFQILSLSTFAFNECSDIIIFAIIFVVKSSKGFGLNNVGPASQTVDQHYISIGLSIVSSGVSDDGILKVTSIMQKSEKTVQSPNPVSMTGQRRRQWVNIETILVECPCNVYNRPGDRLMLGQCLSRLTAIEPAKGCNAGDSGGSHTRRRHSGFWPMRKTNTLISCL